MSKNRGNKKVEECILSIEGLSLNEWGATPNDNQEYTILGAPIARIPMLNNSPTINITATIGNNNISVSLSGDFINGDFNKMMEAQENGKPMKLSLTI